MRIDPARIDADEVLEAAREHPQHHSKACRAPITPIIASVAQLPSAKRSTSRIARMPRMANLAFQRLGRSAKDNLADFLVLRRAGGGVARRRADRSRNDDFRHRDEGVAAPPLRQKKIRVLRACRL
jgi:hypothetical protein